MKLKLLPRDLTNEMIDAWSDVEPRAPAWDWRVMYDAAPTDATERLITVLRNAAELYAELGLTDNDDAEYQALASIIKELGE